MDPLVKEGYLEKQGMMKFLWKKHYFHLEGNTLSYYKEETKKPPLLGSVDMSKVQTVRKSTSSSKGYEIELQTRTKTLVLSALTSAECSNWVEHLQRAMQFERRKSSLLSQPSFFSTSEDAPDDTYDDCREDTEANAEVFYDDTQNISDASQSTKIGAVAVSQNTTELYEAFDEKEETDKRESTKSVERESQASYGQEIYDTIQEDNLPGKNVGKGEVTQNEQTINSEADEIYDTIQDGGDLKETRNENVQTKDKVVDKVENNEEEEDEEYTTIETDEIGYDTIGYKQKSPVRNPAGYTLVTLKSESADGENNHDSSNNPDDDDNEEETYDDISELIHSEPVPELPHGEVQYSKAVRDIKEYLENNRPGSEVFVAPVCEGDEGKGVDLLREYLKGVK